MASPMPYATYQGHRRGQSTSSSGTLNNRAGTAIGSSNGIGGADSPNSTLQRPTISISKVATMTTHDAVPPTIPASPLRAGQVRSMSSNGGPPPLRTISSLRSAAAATAATSPPPALRTAKGKESSGGSDKAEVSNASPSNSSSPAAAGLDLSRRTVSSSLAIPTDNNGSSSTSSLSISQNDSPSLRSNGHFKRHSYSSSNNATASLHARSASSSNTILPNFPQHMSTAQRLRSSNQSSNTPTGSSSNASSPTATPRGLSPSLEAMMGSGLTYQQVQSMTNFDSDTIGRRTTYRPGFQPKGMYRVRTDEFTAARERRREGKSGSSSIKAGEETKARKELESQRLERRLEKLLALHYESTPVSLDSIPSWLPNTLRKTRQMAEEERRIRDEEMRIVKWEEDSTRKICPICQTPFSLSVRKHHCRLCGRIVCASPQLSLPPGFDGNNNNNSNDSGKVEDMKCSSLMVADGKGGTIIKDMPKWEDRNGIKEVAEGGRRGIRICRDCRETIMHRQYMLDDGSVPAYLRLYEALITLQKEIEQSLPEFTEMVLGLQKQDAAAALGTTGVGGAGAEAVEDILSPTRIDASASAASSLAAIKAKNKNSLALQRDAAQARKQLLANFANYDLIAKKIRNIDDEGNASLARIKGAIWTKANLFLQQNMFPLQSLPKLSTKKEKEKRKTGSGTNTPTSDNGDKGSTKDPIVLPFRSMLEDEASGGGNRRMDVNADARAVELVQKDPGAAKESLVVLEQQLKLVREYAASASKARKFQDAKSLKASAQDLEAEIVRLKRLGVTTS